MLGCGLNHIYPKENEWLFHEILRNKGCIISEYAPHIPPDTKNFPKRNRIISGMADAVLVVEAEYRSGSSITANYAKAQDKKVYAIPSNIDVSTGIGTNHLIRSGASLVTKASQIQKELFQTQTNPIRSKQIINQDKLNFYIEIPEEYQRIYTLLENGPMQINEIAKKQELSISELNGKLTIMEIEGYIERLDSNQYQRKE
ncbi:MAG: hypothetical protein HFJ26_07620 [Clostridia bacterium]|nr:hypothetical protein [Clostridia bacterium]